MAKNAKRPTIRRRGWAARIRAAKRRGTFTDDDKARAASFRTCKVSEYPRLYRKVPDWPMRLLRVNFGHPIYNAGVEFADAVRYDDVSGAAVLAEQIDRRARRYRAPSNVGRAGRHVRGANSPRRQRPSGAANGRRVGA